MLHVAESWYRSGSPELCGCQSATNSWALPCCHPLVWNGEQGFWDGYPCIFQSIMCVLITRTKLRWGRRNRTPSFGLQVDSHSSVTYCIIQPINLSLIDESLRHLSSWWGSTATEHMSRKTTRGGGRGRGTRVSCWSPNLVLSTIFVFVWSCIHGWSDQRSKSSIKY